MLAQWREADPTGGYFRGAWRSDDRAGSLPLDPRHLPGDPLVAARARVVALEQALFEGVGKGCALGLRRRPDGLFQARDGYSRNLNRGLEAICRQIGEAKRMVAELEGEASRAIEAPRWRLRTLRPWPARTRAALITAFAAAAWATAAVGLSSLYAVVEPASRAPIAPVAGGR